MAATDTEISSLTSDADLTEIHAQSGLPFSHESRRTKKGFLVTGDRLRGYVPTPPGKKPPHSWVWDYGEAITRVSDGESLHLCRLCYDNPMQSLVHVTANHTTRIQRHMKKKHRFDSKGSRKETVEEAEKAKQGDVRVSIKRQAEIQATPFDRSDFQTTFIAWAVSDDISLARTTSKRLRTLVTYRNPFLTAILPENHSTTRAWIMQAYQASTAAVRRSLARARSRIALSFDGWKSDNNLDLLGVTAHYIDEQYHVKNVLLGLRNTFGSHRAEEQAHHLVAIAREYKISTRISYFMADNASNNDRTLHLLEDELNINPKKSRLRCAAHIMNLVTKAILYGTDTDCIDDVLKHVESADPGDVYDGNVSQFEATLKSQDELAVLRAWRKKGPVGKLHNIVLHARATPARRMFFASKQREADTDCNKIYELVVNGGIRWNSTCDMIERALKLKDALELYQRHFNGGDDEPLDDDSLTSDDWTELKDLYNLLSPLKDASLAVQSDGKDSKHGSLFENLQSMEWLLHKLEALKKQYHHRPSTHFKASINLGWKKLNKYYTLSDETAAYRAAIALHPSYKMSWFEDHWREDHPQWIDQAKQEVEALFKDYKRRHGDEVVAPVAKPLQEMSEFRRFNTIKSKQAIGDELERYLREECTPEDTNPLTWWQLNQERYPVLRHMAFDLLAAPASSSDCERTFSKAGHVLDKEHYNTKDDLAQAQQCVKSAIDEDITFSMGDGEFATPACETFYSLMRRISRYQRNTSYFAINRFDGIRVRC
jgi:hypothetical protein